MNFLHVHRLLTQLNSDLTTMNFIQLFYGTFLFFKKLTARLTFFRNKMVSSNCRTCGWFSDLWCDNDINRNKVCFKISRQVIGSITGEFVLTLKFDKSYEFQETKRVYEDKKEIQGHFRHFDDFLSQRLSLSLIL